MSAAVAGAPPAARRPSPFAHALQRQLGVAVYLAAWFWAVALVCLVAASLVVWRVNGSVDVSVVQYARQATIWFPFSQAILLVAALLRPHVAAGMTRRTFLRASLLTAVATGVLYTLVLVGLLLVERAVHGALGWDTEVWDLPASADPEAGELLGLFGPAMVLANLSGLLVGAVYHRGGAWWGTLTLPLTVAPVLVALAAGGEWFTWDALDPWAGATAGVVVALVLGAVTAVAYVLVLRSIAIRTPR
ncbi:hypothetical protein [Cellulomonas shaoxiangyii]|uniref:Uncharacterized protein n=1 Tax=Cellulomonas shaoxiangyii TaxID=2566013 RepID=A0A4P7SEM0_9CELL|nr:hypothetical protein [Cellulomonas shaoxiangyii]QCB92482.1 hypothetical protein E5225_01840 [Cellulomonas shaoxiangyii]TGY84966.1 hypothetical protein E5226_08810 [Cellulomonas shaoxiangyii]